jgi:hypothetical protein
LPEEYIEETKALEVAVKALPAATATNYTAKLKAVQDAASLLVMLLRSSVMAHSGSRWR